MAPNVWVWCRSAVSPSRRCAIEVLRVLGQFGSGDAYRPRVERSGGQREEQHPTDDLDEAVETFEDDRDIERAIEKPALAAG